MAELETGGAVPPGGDAGEAEAWAEVERGWQDEARHRAYLARFHDLEGLAVAGHRYRAVLDARPTDEMALRFREEIVRRATAQVLAARRAPRAGGRPRLALRVVAVLVALALAAVAALSLRELLTVLGGRR